MIVGYEGLIGAALMLGVLLPIVSVLPGKDGDGIHEDTADTWHVSLSCFFLLFLLLFFFRLVLSLVLSLFVCFGSGRKKRRGKERRERKERLKFDFFLSLFFRLPALTFSL